MEASGRTKLIPGALKRTMRYGMSALASLALALGATAVIAQTTVQEIIVEAPHMVTRSEVGRTNTGAPIEEIILSREVFFDDLDLKEQSAVTTLEARVRDAATRACAELDKLYPASMYPTTQGSGDCVRTAMNTAMPQVARAITAAGQQAAASR